MDKYPTFNKTRIAPTPSGYLHLGNILSFAITVALAEKTGAKVFLRIDDFDMERTRTEFVQDIFDTLDFLGIQYDEGPGNMKEYEQEYSIVHRMDLYRSALKELKEKGMVFACNCSRTQVLASNADGAYPGTCSEKNIPLDAPNTSWRIKDIHAKAVAVKTLNGIITTDLPVNMQQFIVRKKDGYPAYQLTSLLDDVHFGIDLIVRGEDLWPSTVAQLYLSSLLTGNTYADTTFYHHPLLMGQDGKKLAKSDGAPSIHYFRKEHKTPADIYSMIANIVQPGSQAGNWQELAAIFRL
jgi:glutamyl/glutaminyl-tRNA synthetase